MKKRLLKLLGKFANQVSMARLIKASGQSFISPVYHLSSDEATPHISHIYPVRNTALFSKDLDFFLSHYQPVSLSEVSATIADAKSFNQPSFYLSFDDGLREIYDFVAPILKQKGIPATFFINSAFVDNQKLFYRYKASLLVEHFKKNNWSKTVVDKVLGILIRENIQDHIPQGLMKITYQNQDSLDEIADILDYDFQAFLKEYQPYMNREQIQSLINDGFTIGGHSIDHPEYRFISLDEQLSQTRESVDWLEEHFSMPIRNFAFPFTDFGVKKAFFEQVEQEKMLEISFGCAGIKTDTFPWHVQRLPMEGDYRSPENIVKTEYLYYLLKQGLGKNHIQRV